MIADRWCRCAQPPAHGSQASSLCELANCGIHLQPISLVPTSILSRLDDESHGNLKRDQVLERR